MIFNIEEMSLIGVIDHRNRRLAMIDLQQSMPEIADKDLKELCEKTLQKVSAMTDAEFAAIDFTVYEEDKDHDFVRDGGTCL